MAMNRGTVGTYSWAECVSADVTLADVVRRLKRYFLGLRAVNVSWDSGVFMPSEAELSQGWRVEAGRAISPILDDAITEKWPSDDCGFEEWYLFSQLPSNLLLSPYCNWLGISVGEWEQLVNVPDGLDLRRQLEAAQPDVVLGEGQRLFAISRDAAIIQDFVAVCGERPGHRRASAITRHP
jgi:hypothetical protein